VELDVEHRERTTSYRRKQILAQGATLLDFASPRIHHICYADRPVLSPPLVRFFSILVRLVGLNCFMLGPKVNNVDRLAELRHAGVNIGKFLP
jgi:hypothetical protein